MSAPERRKFTRIPFHITAHLVNATGSWHTPLLDISLKGALIDRPKNWNAARGEHFLMELDLGDHESIIRMEIEVAHTAQDHVGLHCLHIGLDSITHLRRLIELNLGEEALLDRELAALIEEHKQQST
ncbi:MAG: PilZ domain-containing protein [Pseudomonadota bacterium]